MRIAYIYDAVYPWVKGGAEKRVYELSQRLAVRGHDVHCYGIKWWDGEKTIRKEGVFLHGICAPMRLYSGERRSIKEAVWFASKLLSSFSGEFDVVDCQEFPYIPCFSAKLLTKTRGGELFITWHEVWGEYWKQYLGRIGFVGNWLEKAATRLTDNNIAVSERTRRDLVSLGVEGVRVVPNGIDFQAIQQIRASDLTSDVVYAGRLVKHKNLDMLIEALRLVKREVPDIKAIVIGDGPERFRLGHMVIDLGLEENVVFTGFAESYNEMISRIKSSKLFVLPSMREGFGIVALEANACGLPVATIRHRMNAACDLVTRETGLVFEPNEKSLAEMILIGMEMKKNAKEHCIELAKRYDWEKICDMAEKEYTTEI